MSRQRFNDIWQCLCWSEQPPERPEGCGLSDNHLLLGTRILKELVTPWAWTNQVVCADSYFASVGAALELRQIGLGFIGVVKSATKHFPMAYLSRLEFNHRGDRKGLLMKDGLNGSSLMAFVWIDCDCQYFISSVSSLDAGSPFVRYRWRQIQQLPNADPERIEIVVPQPKAAELYYTTCGMVDRHNRHRQDTLVIERKVGTLDWSMRVNLSIFGMLVVDTWLAYSQCTGRNGGTGKDKKQKDFYTYLAEELVDNQYDIVGGNRTSV